MKHLFAVSMMFICLSSLLGLVIFPAVHAQTAGDGSPALTKVWETGPGLKVPESVIFCPLKNVVFVSSINGKPMEKNGAGFISKLSLTGDILALEWASGLNAPKGMAIFGRTLYVSDIDHLIAVDLDTGQIRERFPAPGAVFLNDVAADTSGRIYVSDSSNQNSVIYCLADGRLTPWLQSEAVSRPNGLYIENGMLLVGNSGDGCLKTVSLADQSVRSTIKVGSGIDGLQPDGRGNIIISDWKGKTALVTPSGQTRILMDTTREKINSADLAYVRDAGLLLIPTFFDNRIVAYRFK